MALLASLEPVLGSTAKVRILRVLCQAPDAWLTEAELARRIRMSPNTVNLAVRDLAASGLVSALIAGRSQPVRLNASSPLASALRDLFGSETKAVERLANVARPLVGGREAIVLFGSAARGDMTDRSDVDIAIVASSYERAAELDVRFLQEARRIHPGPYRMIHYLPREIRAKWNTPLLRAIREEGVLLAGHPLGSLQ